MIETGTATSFLDTAAYAFVASNYPEDIDKAMAVMEGVVGIGSTSGPVIGSLLYDSFGYSATFYIIGALIAPSSLLILCLKTIPQADRVATEESQYSTSRTSTLESPRFVSDGTDD